VNKTSSETVRANWSRADTKRAFLRVGLFFLLFLGSHWLFQRLHPFGAHSFFWNLALGALTAWVLVRLFLRRFDRDPSEGAQTL
jgi:hypothetical protein